MILLVIVIMIQFLHQSFLLLLLYIKKTFLLAVLMSPISLIRSDLERYLNNISIASQSFSCFSSPRVFPFSDPTWRRKFSPFQQYCPRTDRERERERQSYRWKLYMLQSIGKRIKREYQNPSHLKNKILNNIRISI